MPPEWLTHAEKTDYRETPSYDATIEYAKRLDQASPLIKFETFGKSGEGRDLPLLIAAEDETFTPEAARSAAQAGDFDSGVYSRRRARRQRCRPGAVARHRDHKNARRIC